MHLMNEDDQYGRNTQHVLKRLKTFALFDGDMYISFNIMYHKRIYFTKKKMFT